MKKSKLYARSFLLFLFFFKLLVKKKECHLPYRGASVFVKPTHRRRYTLLRAPYRYKVARIHLLYKRYFLCLHLSIVLPLLLHYENMADVSYTLSLILRLSNHFDTLFIQQHKMRLGYNIMYRNNFLLKKFC